MGVFVAGFIIFMTTVFLPQVRALHNELQKKRSMLLFLPALVIRSVHSIRELVDEILADDQSGLGRSAPGRANAVLRAAEKDGGGGGGAATNPLIPKSSFVGGLTRQSSVRQISNVNV